MILQLRVSLVITRVDVADALKCSAKQCIGYRRKTMQKRRKNAIYYSAV